MSATTLDLRPLIKGGTTDDSAATNLSDLSGPAGDTPETAPSLPAYLILLAGGTPGALIRLAPEGTRVGRSSDNTIHLHNPTASRYHAVLRKGDDGREWLTDLASTNGTFLNGRRIPNHTPVVLHDDDRVQFGTTVMFKYARPDPCEEQFQREMFARTVRDGLTGLYNRSYFLDQVDLLAEQGEARGLGLAIVMLDVDYFKRVNDTHGHDSGDMVLKEVARVIRQSTRSEDLVARYGGEEFVAALPIGSFEQATNRAECIRRNLAGLGIAVKDQTLHVTVSSGLAYAPFGRRPPTTALIAAADRCLYKAKETGRNRVVGSQGSPYDQAEIPTSVDDRCSVLLIRLPEMSGTADGEF